MMLARRSAAPLLPSLRGGCGAQKLLFSSTAASRADFTHVVVGGGVVGLAIARQLALRPSTSTLLVERHAAVGTETSSPNSEVIHAGIYYGAASLKTRLCVRGRQLLYDFCARHAVAHRRTGKWIVAQTDTQRAALERIHAFCRDQIGVETRWVGEEEVARDGEGVRARTGALESPTTGIVDAHALMLCLLGLFEDAGGVVALNSPVTGVRPLGSSPPGRAGWEVDVGDASTGESSTITAETLVNAAGLGAVDVHNMIVPAPQRRRLFFAKGNYFSCAASHPRVSRLIYPAPEPGAGGLGTHLTLDLGGRVRFGPDVEWVDSPGDMAVSAARLPQAVAEIEKYLPAVDASCLTPDYAGIRPKLSRRAAMGAGTGFNDFVIRREDGYEGWVNLLGIESPGLTSSLAIAEEVDQLMHGSGRRQCTH
ncbi:L-2-hydroxyglutarate dehydrogenase, mitochondrial [Tolypocladium ophioglossoides CBS 100239]|uniref:L-2-hydroxyglutarate dehydrogenase, mitochondrial n=1 Tax=Tolypocladium ophioglossoides (strain CBS 100239) TaxID=1163406 RepID=A0A0L0NHR4_TOLOC|nr:L-2-hydroxyglutarate dehydrogenase, mitochondrial [Tolypocladium ophioglossoides CBS 100239]